MCFSTVKKKKYNRCQNYMYVIYSLYMTCEVTKNKDAKHGNAEAFFQ